MTRNKGIETPIPILASVESPEPVEGFWVVPVPLPLLHTKGPWNTPDKASFWNPEQSTDVLLLSRSKPSLTIDSARRLGLFETVLVIYVREVNQGTNVEKFPIKMSFPISASRGKLITLSMPFPSTCKLPPTEYRLGIDKFSKFVLLETIKAPCPVVKLPTENKFGAENDKKEFP
jgi:hypothetical protein